MKSMKQASLLFMMGCMVVSVADAALLTSYSASDSPGSAPDGNGDTDVWTVTGFDGANRSFYEGSFDGNAGMWAIWDRDTAVDGGPSGTYATHTFAGGALTVGQSVTLDYSNANVANGERVGIRLLDGSTAEAEFSFLGGGDYYSHSDSDSAGVYTDTPMQWHGGDIFQVAFTKTGVNTYLMSVTEGSTPGFAPGTDNDPSVGSILDSWTGTFTGSAIDGIQVFTEGGDGSDQRFDNLSVVPEPATLGLIAAMGGGMLFIRRLLL